MMPGTYCYAYQLGFDKSAYRVNDDGEPSGTDKKTNYLIQIFII